MLRQRGDQYPNYESIYTWGWNNGALGYETKGETQNTPTEVDQMKNKTVKLVAAGGSHTLVVTEVNKEQKLWTVGQNQSGQLGIGNEEPKQNFVEVPLKELAEWESGDYIVSIAAGDRHSGMVSNRGKVYTWGQNHNGQLGLGHKTSRNKPQLVKGLRTKTIVHLVCGARHTIFMTKTGRMFAVGQGKFGQLGLGDHLDSLHPKLINVPFRVTKVVCQEYTTLALTTEYAVYSWGGRPYFEQDTVAMRNTKENRMKMSASHPILESLMKHVEQSIGVESQSKAQQIQSLRQPVALHTPRKLFHNINGRRVIDISVSARYGMALTSDGSIYCWGDQMNRAGYLKYIPVIFTREKLNKEEQKWADQLQLNITDDKRVVSIVDSQVQLYKLELGVPKKETITQVACSEYCGYFLTDSGDLYSFGHAKHEEHGQPGLEECLIPTKVNMHGSYCASLSTGCWHVVAATGSLVHQRSQHYILPNQTIPKCVERLHKKMDDIL